MRISAKGEYAILAMLDLAQAFGNDGVRTLEEISNDKSVPHPFLVQILLELKRSGLVESKRGAGGGYRMAKHPSQVSVGEVVRIIDGPLLPFRCSEHGDPRRSKTDCSHQGHCALTSVWNDVRDAIEHVIDGITFEELSLRQDKLSTSMYYI